MELRELYNYKMNPAELEEWMHVADKVRSLCEKLGLVDTYGVMIKNAISSSIFCDHRAGFCTKIGYYYIEEGDRDKIYLKCQSRDPDEMAFHVMHQKILRTIGRKLEMEKRVELEKNWTGNNNYDSRKYWFEYVIGNLAKVFEGRVVEKVILQYTGYMNRWFDDEHWQFDREKMEFVEVSDSKEHD